MINAGIRQDNTWLVVDPIVGCIHDCQYCFLRVHGLSNRPGEVMMPPSVAVEQLLSYWAFRQTSVVMVGSETDMFMNERNRRYISEFVRCYDAQGIKNPLCICTKARIPDDFIELAQKVKSTTLVFYISFSGLGRAIEPNVDPANALSNLERLAEAGQRVIHLLRPVMPQNADRVVLASVLDSVQRYASCTVIRGLNLNDDLQKLAWFWPEVRNAEIDFTKVVSTWPKHFFVTLDTIMSGYPAYPLFLNNPCALAHVLGRPDPLGAYGSSRCQRSWCPEGQQRVCKTAHAARVGPTCEEALTELRRLGLNNDVSIDEMSGDIVINGALNHEQTACLSQVMRCQLRVDSIQSDHEWGGYVIGHDDNLI